MSQTRTELIHCENCGEDYAATYRRCPFCNQRGSQRQQGEYASAAAAERDGRRQSGKRLASGSGRGPRGSLTWLYILLAAVVLLLILLLCFVVLPQLFDRATSSPSPAPVQSLPAAVEPSLPAESLPPEEEEDPYQNGLPVLDENGNVISQAPGVTPSAPATAVPSAGAASTPASSAPAATPAPAGPRLSKTDFSITAQYPDPVRLKVTGGEAASWSSSKESVATVSGNGTVTAVDNGTAKITCTLTDGKKLTCTVHVSGKGAAASASQAPAASQAPTASAKLTYAGVAKEEFTISAANPAPVPLKVSGGTAASWSSSNEKVATVSGGTVTAKGNGTAKITCTLTDGKTLTCTVRVTGF